MVSEEDQGVRQGDKLPDMNKAIQVYTISSSSSSSSSVGSWNVDHLNDSKVAFPRDLLPSLPRGRVGTDLAVTEAWPLSMRPPTDVAVDQMPPGGLVFHGCKQFWKAGDYDVSDGGFLAQSSVGMEHVRVHPKFLHSNATSHKWALAAFAELLDNSLDETCHGATYVCVDVLEDEKYGSKMLLVEEIDLAPRIPMNTTLHLQCCVHRNMSTKMWKNSSENNGGGMTPDKMRQCMSLGYSVKSKMANTIGQYGNGFKTSTMRLGADVIVFSRCPGNDGQSLTQSIGMLSYTFLRANRKDDIVVPMIDYEKRGQEWSKITRTSLDDWNTNLETILLWSPYTSEEDLLEQFKSLKYHGTRIVIYNLWEDDEGNFELDFDTDQHDIRLRGVNKELSKQMADQYPHSRHFLTYRCSLRSYASILYLKLPPNFRIILRGEDIHHHSIVNDMMLAREITYKPKRLTEEMRKDPNMFAVVTIGFVKDAKSHIDIQGFNVYHRNRLIKPFWRVWNAAGSDGRGVIGVLEANFVEPSHDKQGFEHTGVLSRLEHRLLTMQKAYWSSNCQEIGYAARRRRGGSADKRSLVSAEEKSTNQIVCIAIPGPEPRSPAESSKRPRPGSPSSREYEQGPRSNSKEAAMIADGQVPPDDQSNGLTKSKEENGQSRESLKELGNPDEMPQLLSDLKYEREMRKSLELQVKPLELQVKSLELQLQEKESKMEELKRKVEELNQERIALIDSFSEEKNRKDALEETLMKSLRKASETIAGLLEKGGR